MLKTILRKERMAQLVRRIPRGVEIKEAPNELQQLHDRIVESVTKKYTSFKEEIDRQLAEIKSSGVTSSEAEKKAELMMKRMEMLEAEIRRPEQHLPPVLKTVGQRFIESDGLKAFAGRWQRGGFSLKFEDLSKDERFNPFFKGESVLELKTTITSSAVGSSTPGILVPMRVPGIIPKPERRLTIRDLLPFRPTNNNAVEYVQENVFTNAASPAVETNAKAESALTFVIAFDNVRLIAHWIPASRQILDDFDGLRSFIDRKLLYGLKLKEETELLNGDNLGDHLNGLTTRATAYAGTYNASGDTKIDKLRHAILEAEDDDEVVTGIVLHPKDWHDISLVKTEEGGANKGTYIVGDPSGGEVGLMTMNTLWGKPVVQTNSMGSGKFLVGAFATQAEIFDRMQAVIDVSTEHSDYFTKNLVAIRAEERLCLAVYRAGAFIYGSF